MKTARLMLALFALLILTTLQAQAAPDSLKEHAISNLTEVFGYTQEEAEAFHFQDDGRGTFSFWPESRPQWVYTLSYEAANQAVIAGTSPFFAGNYSNFPGESAMRDVLRLADEQGWFTNWDESALQGFEKALRDPGQIRPSTSLAMGLEAGDITASQALTAFFASCLGEAHLHTPAAQEWQQAVMEQYGLAPEAPYLLPEGEVVTVQRGSHDRVTLTRFASQAPAALETAFAHPRLQGWRLIGGATQEYQVVGPERLHTGLAAFEREGEQLLVMLTRREDAPWKVHPASQGAQKAGASLVIRHHDAGYGFVIENHAEPDLVTSFHVVVRSTTIPGQYVCALESYRQENRQTKSAFEAKLTTQGWVLLDLPGPGQEISRVVEGAVFGFLDAISQLDDVPATMQAWQQLPARLAPEGYASLSGVHLRQKTSSRSRDLGLFIPGTLVRVLGQEPGDPFPWLHGQIGRLSGYISTLYVNPPESEHGRSLASTLPLPVAQTTRDTRLKAGTGWLDGSLQDLPAGTRMHVLSDQGGWLYVVVPRGELGWLMDVEGTYGFVQADQVIQAATALQLAWLANPE